MDPPIRVISHGRLDTLDDYTEEIWPSKFLVTLKTGTQRNYSDHGQQEPLHYWIFSTVLKIVFLDLFSILALRILINLKQFLPLMLCQHILHNLLWPLWILISSFMVSSSSAWNLNWNYSGLFSLFLFSWVILSICMIYFSFIANLWLCTKSCWFFPTKILFNSIHLSSSFLTLFHSSHQHILSYYWNAC